MRAHVAIHLEQWFLDYVRSFINGNAESEVLRMKRDHSQRVAEDMTGIARDLGLAEDDVHTARILGWLHDVGRFHQYAQYRTLRDDQSVNHGQVGLQVLDSAQVLLVCEPADRELIRMGTGCHNRRTVPPGMAAVMPTIRSLSLASLTMVSEKTCVYVGGPSPLSLDLPVSRSNGPTPW